MSCAIATFSARTAYAASATSRSLSSRASSSSSVIQRSSQGNINSKRCQNSKLHDARPFSTAPKWTEDGDSGTVMGLTAFSALVTAGCTAAFIAHQNGEDSTAHCSSMGIVPDYDNVAVLKEAISLGPGIRRMLNKPTSQTEKIRVKLGSDVLKPLENDANDLGSTNFSSMAHHPKADTLKSGMLQVVETSVQQASTWEKKAMAVVDDFRKDPRYEVSKPTVGNSYLLIHSHLQSR